MRGNKTDRDTAPRLSDDAVWRRSLAIDAVEDEAERYLDLAGFADGRLDPDERERVAEWLARNPEAAADIAAARALATAGEHEAAPEPVVARAAALACSTMPDAGNIVPLRATPRAARPLFPAITQWGSLAAAMVLASWLGFSLGSDASIVLGPIDRIAEDGLLQELFDPSAEFMRDLTAGVRT
jgi:anti-sigma factor RsiW